MLREPCRIGNVAFTNRVLRSSMGGRNCCYDGTVSPAFIHFERRFAESGVAGIISATIGVNKERMSPLEYPSLYDDRFVAPLKDAVSQITAGTDCRYIVQLGDTGAHTHTSLKPQDEDRISASSRAAIAPSAGNATARSSVRRPAGALRNSPCAAAGLPRTAACDWLWSVRLCLPPRPWARAK